MWYMIGSWFRRLWYPSAPSPAPMGDEEPALVATSTVAVRSPTKKRARAASTIPAGPAGATTRQRPKRGDPATAVYCSPDVMSAGTARMAAAHQAAFDVHTEDGTLHVSFPAEAHRKRRASPPAEEYEWIPSKEELRNRLAVQGYANPAGTTTLLALAMDAPALFWNAVYWCQGDVSRIEEELLFVL